mgnify:CR=1 FL=1
MNNGRVVPPEEEVILKNIFRIEVQISKKGIYNLRLPTGREIRPFLDESFCREYLLKEIKEIARFKIANVPALGYGFSCHVAVVIRKTHICQPCDSVRALDS